MPSLTIQKTASGLVGLAGSRTVTDQGAEIAGPASVAAAKAGTLTTRTSNTAGTLTMSPGHGIVTGQRVDLYWSGGSCYGAIVGTVAGDSVPIASVSGGDNLPLAATAIQVGIITTVAFDLTGNNVTALVLSGASGYACYWVFVDGASAQVAFRVATNEMYSWTGDGTNPLAAFVPVSVRVSHADTSASKTGMVAAALKH